MSKLYYTASSIITLFRWPSGAQFSLNLRTGRPHTDLMISIPLPIFSGDKFENEMTLAFSMYGEKRGV